MVFPFGNYKRTLVFVIGLLLTQAIIARPIFLISRDSLRSETSQGQRVIIYLVEKGETYYSIARKYQINPKSLVDFNHNIKSLTKGQEIMIPRGKSFVNAQKETKNVSKSVEGFAPNKVIKVQKGETLFSIAKGNGITIDKLKEANNLQNKPLHVGQKLFIPAIYPAKGKLEDQTNNDINSDTKPRVNPEITSSKSGRPISALLAMPSNGIYVVGPGETVYSIGFKYGVGIEELRNLNLIQNNEIKVGQSLKLRADAVLPSGQEPIPSKGTMANEELKSEIKKEEKPEVKSGGNLSNLQKHALTAVPDNDKIKSNPTEKIILPTNEAPRRSRNIPRAFKEEGMGIWVDNNDLNQARSVALHKLAPVGTVIKVTNPMTRRSIFVKVVGSFPETEDTKNAILVISKSAAKLIGALDPHFRVELTYAY